MSLKFSRGSDEEPIRWSGESHTLYSRRVDSFEYFCTDLCHFHRNVGLDSGQSDLWLAIARITAIDRELGLFADPSAGQPVASEDNCSAL